MKRKWLAHIAVLSMAPFTSAGQNFVSPSPTFSDSDSFGLIRPQYLQDSIVNPALSAQQNQPQSRPAEEPRLHTWELPAVNVTAEPGPLREEDLVGPNAQPRWTADRRFSETRIYVIPEGKFEFEYWFIPTANRKGPADIRQQFEAEMGLPYRFQLDLYLIPERAGSDEQTFLNSSVEVRYAFAEWGKIWGNPTLYVEYTFNDGGPDTIETKLLLGGEIAPRWHWGANASYEHEVSGEMSNEYEITSGISYTVKDEKFSVGAEEKAGIVDVHNRRGHFTDFVLLGPSIQYRPLPQVHIDVAPLIGLTHESPALQAFVVVGWEF